MSRAEGEINWLKIKTVVFNFHDVITLQSDKADYGYGGGHGHGWALKSFLGVGDSGAALSTEVIKQQVKACTQTSVIAFMQACLGYGKQVVVLSYSNPKYANDESYFTDAAACRWLQLLVDSGELTEKELNQIEIVPYAAPRAKYTDKKTAKGRGKSNFKRPLSCENLVLYDGSSRRVANRDYPSVQVASDFDWNKESAKLTTALGALKVNAHVHAPDVGHVATPKASDQGDFSAVDGIRSVRKNLISLFDVVAQGAEKDREVEYKKRKNQEPSAYLRAELTQIFNGQYISVIKGMFSFSRFPKGHHHNKRAIAVCKAIQNADTLEKIEAILLNQYYMFTSGRVSLLEKDGKSDLLNKRWSSVCERHHNTQEGYLEAVQDALRALRNELPAEEVHADGNEIMPRAHTFLRT